MVFLRFVISSSALCICTTSSATAAAAAACASGDPSMLVAKGLPASPPDGPCILVMNKKWRFNQFSNRGDWGSNACLQVCALIATKTVQAADVIKDLWDEDGCAMQQLVMTARDAWDARPDTRAQEAMDLLPSELSAARVGDRVRFTSVVLEERRDWKFVGLLCSTPSPSAFVLTLQSDKALPPHSACF